MNITKLAQPRKRYYQPDRKTTQADIDKFLKARDAFFEIYNAHPVWKDVRLYNGYKGCTVRTAMHIPSCLRRTISIVSRFNS